MDHLGWRPVDLFLSAFTSLLLLKHLVENGDDPVFEGAVVRIRNNEVSNAVETLAAEFGSRGTEGTNICVTKALDEILFDATSRGDDT